MEVQLSNVCSVHKPTPTPEQIEMVSQDVIKVLQEISSGKRIIRRSYRRDYLYIGKQVTRIPWYCFPKRNYEFLPGKHPYSASLGNNRIVTAKGIVGRLTTTRHGFWKRKTEQHYEVMSKADICALSYWEQRRMLETLEEVTFASL